MSDALHSAATAAQKTGRSRLMVEHGVGYRWFYIWRFPLRLTHWISGLAILVLIVTGFYVGRPFATASGEAPGYAPMSWMRGLHLWAAGALVAMAILRVYWLFFGNKYERWRALLPSSRRALRNTLKMVWAYVRIRPEQAPQYLGHNPLQAISYTLFYAISIAAIATGFALYGVTNPGGFFYRVFGWLSPLLGGWQMVRLVHHLLLWAFVIFIPLHVYLVIRAAVFDQDGTISSIFTGARYVREDVEFEDV
jgi:Ni/Fe-hydrogenase b-type cytochrome subunit